MTTEMRPRLMEFEPFPVLGQVAQVTSGVVMADGPDATVGSHCLLRSRATGRALALTHVAAVQRDGLTLVPFEPVSDVRIGDQVELVTDHASVAVGPSFAGRAVDALGRPIDGRAAPTGAAPRRSLPPVLDRTGGLLAMATGIRAVDGLLTIGRGMRIGIFAASGVGKTTLVEQILRQSDAERIVVCLIGERGREVEDFWRLVGGDKADRRVTLVAATSDELAPMRAQAVDTALLLAEFWRDAGENVLLLVDSITRLAMALREIGLAAGEPPTARAYTPNVFRELPRVVERCGAVRGRGSITAIFTVLSESDDVDDPIVETMKSLLDGHIVLSRRLAQAGHFPAIDVSRSISRLFDRLVDPGQRDAAQRCRAWIARHDEARLLIESGMYKPGGDCDLDQAVAARPAITAFLQQDHGEAVPPDQTRAALRALAAAKVAA